MTDNHETHSELCDCHKDKQPLSLTKEQPQGRKDSSSTLGGAIEQPKNLKELKFDVEDVDWDESPDCYERDVVKWSDIESLAKERIEYLKESGGRANIFNPEIKELTKFVWGDGK